MSFWVFPAARVWQTNRQTVTPVAIFVTVNGDKLSPSPASDKLLPSVNGDKKSTASGVSSTTVRNALKQRGHSGNNGNSGIWYQVVDRLSQCLDIIIQARSLTPCDYQDVHCAVGLLTGHSTPAHCSGQRQVTSLCPLCQEEKAFYLHFLGKCNAALRIRFEL